MTMNVGAEHTVKAFDDEIGRLRGLISEMGGHAEAAIAGAMDVLVRRDLPGSQIIVENDRKIDALETEVERLQFVLAGLTHNEFHERIHSHVSGGHVTAAQPGVGIH